MFCFTDGDGFTLHSFDIMCSICFYLNKSTGHFLSTDFIYEGLFICYLGDIKFDLGDNCCSL